MPDRYSPGELLRAALTFTSQTGAKKRPVLAIRDVGDDDLLLAPVSGQAARVAYDIVLADWRGAGLRLPSVVRVEKLATIEKSTVLRRLGKAGLNDWGRIKESLKKICEEILSK